MRPSTVMGTLRHSGGTIARHCSRHAEAEDWTSDNRCVTILLQYKSAPDGPLENCTDEILQRVQWAESSDDAEMVPSRTEFATVGVPGSPADLARWLRGGFMSGDL